MTKSGRTTARQKRFLCICCMLLCAMLLLAGQGCVRPAPVQLDPVKNAQINDFAATAADQGICLSWQVGEQGRPPVSYRIWRVSQGDTGQQWMLCHEGKLKDCTYTDTQWPDLAMGTYCYALGAVFEDGSHAEPLLSDVFERTLSCLYVTQQGTGTGESWDDALGDLQKALDTAHAMWQADNAGAGVAVYVAQGTYTGCFVLREGVDLFGGYDAATGEPAQQPTVLDAQTKGRPLTQQEDFARQGIVRGVTLQGGYADEQGGGVLLRSGGNLENCILINNEANISTNGRGGGAALLGNAVIRNCQIQNNRAAQGGGLFLSAQAQAINCLIANNTAAKQGGGLCTAGDGVQVLYNTIVYNGAVNGGGMHLDGRVLIAGSTIWGNQAMIGDPQIYTPNGREQLYLLSSALQGTNAAEDGRDYACFSKIVALGEKNDQVDGPHFAVVPAGTGAGTQDWMMCDWQPEQTGALALVQPDLTEAEQTGWIVQMPAADLIGRQRERDAMGAYCFP